MAYILALAIGFGSLALYTAAFFFPEVYRKGDFFWSGVGMFYALILWFCAGRITGAVLLGQLAVVAIVLWFGWQNLMLRRSLTPVAEQTQIKEDLKEQLAGGLSGLPQLVKTGFKKGEQSSVAPPTTPDGTGEQPESEIETDEAIAPPQTDDAEQSRVTEAIAPPQTDDAEQSEVTEAIAPPQTDGSRDADASAEAVREKEEEPVKPGKQKPRGFFGLGNIFASIASRSKKQPKSQPDQKITSSDSPDDESEWDSPVETSAPTAGAPVPDVTASETNALRARFAIETSAVETSEPVTESEQATAPESEETNALRARYANETSAVETSEPVTEPEQATAPEPEETNALRARYANETSAVETSEPVTEPEQATAPEPEETLTGAEAAQEEETAENATASDSGSKSAEIKAKTDD